ncbi:nicotinate phosphoribosyltransferase [Ascosphaera atra]|nr:nicotinate phosphoribosyltransferase [Ascosphaera atra]
MGIAAITDNYEDASELGLRYWVGTFGEGVLGIALTDTFGTPAFLKAFNRPVPAFTSSNGMQAATPSSVGVATQTTDRLAGTTPPPPAAPIGVNSKPCDKTYAQVFAGVRQDSGDPKDYVKMLRDFYHSIGIKEKKQLVFSDSLNIERCFEYKKISEEAGFAPSFGIGTFMTNDFRRLSDGKKSVPLNIVIKISSAGNRPAIKLSDNLGKNTGDHQTVVEVKKRLGYIEKEWKGGDERHRWNE